MDPRKRTLKKVLSGRQLDFMIKHIAKLDADSRRLVSYALVALVALVVFSGRLFE
jgi:hypothetical protein